MSRLLLDSSPNISPDSKNQREPELKDRYQEAPYDFDIEFMECWNGTQKFTHIDVDQCLGGAVCPAYRGKEVNTFAATCVDSMLLGFREGNERGISLNEVNSEHRSDMFNDRNLLTWDNGLSDYSPRYKTSNNIFKDDFPGDLCSGFDSDELRNFRVCSHSYELPTICYDRFSDNSPRKNNLEYKNETADCHLDRTAADIWRPVPLEKFGSFFLGNLWDSDDLDEFLDSRLRFLDYKGDRSDCKPHTGAVDACCPVLIEGGESSAICNSRDSSGLDEVGLRSENCPLLLPWSSDDTNIKASTHLTDMDHELYPSPSRNEDTSLVIHPSTFPTSSMLQDHHTKKRHWLQQKDTFARSKL